MSWREHPLLAYPSVKRWMDRRRNLKDQYRLDCLEALAAYCLVRKATPEQLILEYVRAKRSENPSERLKPEDGLTAWQSKLTNDGRANLFYGANMLKRVRPFYDENGCALSLTVEMPSAPARESTLRATQAITRRFIENTPWPEFKWAFICLAESGMRPASVCELKVRNISGDVEPYQITVSGKITKQGQPYYSFFFDDASQILRSLLKQRSHVDLDSRIVGFNAERLVQYTSALGVQLGYNPPTGLKPFTTGSWREYVQNMFEQVGIVPNRVSLLMGARPQGRDAHYTNPPPEELAREYMKAAGLLRIYN